MTAPKLRNDCFAMPPGVDWVPVDEALERLEAGLEILARTERHALAEAAGQYLASDVRAPRAHPPYSNSAVDGYGFAGSGLRDAQTQSFELLDGRSAAGVPFSGVVPAGKALRILTGAALPEGVDTVVLEEDCKVSGSTLSFGKGLKLGANMRPLGEDVREGALIAARGALVDPGLAALLASVGVQEVDVFQRLRVGVLSTGDEVVPVEARAQGHQIYDANRPMLLSLVARWGMVPVDLGHAADTRQAIETALEKGAREADVVLTSGGASAGDEDHVSAALKAHGALTTWRIAVKPGRPLALGLWDGCPVFGLPGNPVAAFVCTLIFARPAMLKMLGAGFPTPQGFEVPAGFKKQKKQGRREFLRARMSADGRAEIFPSEGSGRVSGLAWADGLVELADGARDIKEGDLVRYIPLSSFGI